MKDFKDEVKLNNWLRTDEGPFRITTYLMAEIMRHNSKVDYEPIIITEAILQKTAFQNNNTTFYSPKTGIEGKTYSYKYYTYFTNSFEFSIMNLITEEAAYTVKNIFFLHQLQNLIFALDNEELFVDLN